VRARRPGDADRPRRRRGVVDGAGASHAEDLDFASVQRDNAEIQRRCQEVIDRCWALGDANPILSIHDVGAGGLSNALPELVHGGGKRRALRPAEAIPSGDPAMAPLELWCNEAQERYVVALAPGREAEFAALCARERAPWAVLGHATEAAHLRRRRRAARRAGGRRAARRDPRQAAAHGARRAREGVVAASRRSTSAGVTVAQALERVLRLPAVATRRSWSRSAIAGRRPGGARPMVGPLAGAGRRRRGHRHRLRRPAGEAMAMGERTAGRAARRGGGVARWRSPRR
jgi:phosphoribosylformylglycinamidine synthase